MTLVQLQPKALIKPRALKPGDRIGLVCPGSRPRMPAVVARSERIVCELGFEPVIGKHVFSIHGYMAGTDEQRLSDLSGFLNDDSIAGVFCITGGFGAIHLLNHLDYDSFARQPKVVVGCDDNTALLNALYAKSGVVTLHGPNLEQIESQITFDRFKIAVTSSQPLATISGAEETVGGGWHFSPVAGVVEGRLVGGNLTAYSSLMGTPFQPSMQDSILVFEDINEQNGILDRWFTQLYLSGDLQRCSGVAFGSFENCGTINANSMMSLMEMFSDRLKYLQKVSCFGLPFGQAPDTSVVPIGIRARLDTSAASLHFLESAVS